MGMTYTFKDSEGNMIFSIEGASSVTENEVSLESMYDDIVSTNNKINNTLEKFSFINDTRAMEALGYEKGAGFKKNMQNVVNTISTKVKEYLDKIIEFFKKILAAINEKINKGVSKQAAAAIVKKIENPDLTKDGVSESLENLINSDDMGIYVAVRKNLTTLFRLNKIVENPKPYTEKDFNEIDKAVAKISDIKESAKHVSSNEKRINAISFYKTVASGGFESFNSEVSEFAKTAKADKDRFDSLKNGMNEEVVKHLYPFYTSIFTLTAQYSKVINRLCSVAVIK